MILEVPVVAYLPLDAALTNPLSEPAPPPKRCLLGDSQPVWCIDDALGWIEDWRVLLRIANDDRARARRIGEAAQAVEP